MNNLSAPNLVLDLLIIFQFIQENIIQRILFKSFNHKNDKLMF